MKDLDFLSELETIIDSRFEQRPQESYTARLLSAGIKRIAQKVAEEGVELALAAVGEEQQAVTDEAADLMFHTLVLLRARDLNLSTVVAELEKRHRNPARSLSVLTLK